jgi:hypothetical protein
MSCTLPRSPSSMPTSGGRITNDPHICPDLELMIATGPRGVIRPKNDVIGRRE